jgi:hypothetical protein
MSQFNIHFFKEKSRKIDIEELIHFFEQIEGMEVEMDDQSVRFLYTHPRLLFKSTFFITPKSHVPDIYRLSPKFLDLNFRMDMPILTPDYMAKHMFELVKRICDTYGFAVYNEMLEDVLPFKMEIIFKVFSMIKDAYISKNPVLLSDYKPVSQDQLFAIYRYLDDLLELQKYYQELNTYVPKYHFLVENGQKLVIAIEWKEQTLTVFPPFLDYILYRQAETVKVVSTKELYPLIEKFLQDVPGFIKGTKVIPKKTAKKVFKIMKKTKFTQHNHTYQKIDSRKLID